MNYQALRNKADAAINKKGAVFYFETYAVLPKISLSSDTTFYLKMLNLANTKINSYGCTLMYLTNPEVYQDEDLITYAYEGTNLLINGDDDIIILE